MLARSFVSWLTEQHPEIDLEVVAFRGGELLDDFVRLAPTHVLLDPSEPWDHAAPERRRLESVSLRTARLGDVDGTLLVSVAAGQILPYLPPSSRPVVAWVVEHGEDLHWLDGPLDLTARVTSWLAGSAGTRDELLSMIEPRQPVDIVEEFISDQAPLDPRVVANCRTALGVAADQLLVIGAGIATLRKAPDLFVEVAMAHGRLSAVPAQIRVARWRARHDVHSASRTRSIGWACTTSASWARWSMSTPWLAAADVFLHPARLDAFPLVCLHAAAVGDAGRGVLGRRRPGRDVRRRVRRCAVPRRGGPGREGLRAVATRPSGVDRPAAGSGSQPLHGWFRGRGASGTVARGRAHRGVWTPRSMTAPLLVVAHEATRTGSPRVLLELLRDCVPRFDVSGRDSIAVGRTAR